MRDDSISRQAAIDAAVQSIMDWDGMFMQEANCRIRDAINELPSAEQRGMWIYLDGLDAFECSVCGRQMVRNIFDYCPWCGAKMKMEENT